MFLYHLNNFVGVVLNRRHISVALIDAFREISDFEEIQKYNVRRKQCNSISSVITSDVANDKMKFKAHDWAGSRPVVKNLSVHSNNFLRQTRINSSFSPHVSEEF